MSTVYPEKEPDSVSSSPLRGRKAEDAPLLLIIDDEEQIVRILTRYLGKEFQVHSATSGLQGLAVAERLKPAFVLLDLFLPGGMNGLEVLEKLQRFTPTPTVVILTAYGEVRSAVQAIKLGAVDYVTKPFEVAKLRQILVDCLHSREPQALRKNDYFQLGNRRIVGHCSQMGEVWTVVEKFAPTDIPILIQGESGTGKELFARALHALSKRSQGPFVPVDCAAVPDTLWESEFFGYEQGAFTGANQAKPGLFMLANGGTLFLDEIGNLPLLLQAKLLRALQEREIRSLGARRSVQSDVRVLSASNVDLPQMVAQDSFRADLYYRLSAVTIALPPLRRREDLPLLLHHFLELYNRQYGKQVRLGEEAVQLLMHYSWPGNCRELENIIRAAVLLAEDRLLPHHIPSCVIQGGETQRGQGAKERQSKDDDLHTPGSSDPAALPTNMNIQISLQVDLQSGLKQVGTTVAKTIEGEIVKRVHSLARSQAETAALLKVDPKTLRARLKAGKNHDEQKD